MRLLVVGGGITGLAAAWEALRGSAALQGQETRPPVEVLVVEAEPRWGGKLHTERTDDGLLIEHGPDSFVAYRPAALQLIDELGLSDQVISTSGKRSVFLRSRGRLQPMPQGMGMVLPTRLGPFVTTRILTPWDKARAGLDLLRPRYLRDDDDVAIGQLLRYRLGGGIVRRFADPMVGGIYGASVDELSLDAVLPSLRQDEKAHRSLMLAALTQGRAARASARTTAAQRGPAQPNSASPRGAASPFRTLRDGVSSLIDALVAQLTAAGADLRAGTRVVALTPTSGGGAVAELSDGTRVEADAVVLAAGVSATSQLLGQAAPQAATAIGEVPLSSSTVLTCAYPTDAFPAPLDTHGWLEAEPAPISGTTIASAKWAGRAPDGTVLIRAFVPARLGPIATAPDAELRSRVTGHIGAVLGARREPTSVHIARWRGVMPTYTVGHLRRVAAAEAGLAGLPAWRVAGSPLRGVGIPDCIQDGRRQAALALDHAHRSPGKVIA